MRRFRYLAVEGDSMQPTLNDGDWVLATGNGRAGVGDVVVLEHPRHPGMLIVKRVTSMATQGFWLLGDNPDASTDSRAFGPVPGVVGRVIWRIRPWGRVH